MPPPDSLDVEQYAREATRRLVSSVGVAHEDWRPTIERGLAAAYRQGDAAGLTSMVQLVAHLLDGVGRYEDAIGELDHALAFARNVPDAAIVLHGIRASALAAPGRMEEARRSLEDGYGLLPRCGATARTRYQVFRKVVLWQALEEESDCPVDSLLADCSALGLTRDRSFLLSWYIPFLASSGDRRGAHPWIRAVKLEAQTSNSRWRASDAAAFEIWDNFVGNAGWSDRPVHLEPENAMSVWRGEAVRLRDATLRGDGAAAEAALQDLQDARRRLASADVGDAEWYRWAARCPDSLVAEPDTPLPPRNANLNNLGTTLAAAECVAGHGSQQAALAWLEALDRLLPHRTQSCLEWPLSVFRVRALLALRGGDVRRARAEFQDGLDWCMATGFQTEEGLTRLQLGELCALADLRVPEKTWQSDRRAGAQILSARGYDPVPRAYAVAHSVTLSSRNRVADRLTRREIQVLGLLAEGRSYREAAEALGIAPATVQTLAHRVYEKLGISGRERAAREARRLGIL